MSSGEQSAWRWSEGQWVEGVSIAPGDRAFRLGMSLFETMRVERGVPLFWQEHLYSLQCSAAHFGLDPSSLVFDTLDSSELPLTANACGLLRLYVTAGGGGHEAPWGGAIYLLFEENRQRPLDFMAANFSLCLLEKTLETFAPGWKTGNYWAYADAYRQARARGCDDGVLVNGRGQIISTARANLFARFGDRVLTPPLSSGARAGIVRQWVCKNCDILERDLSCESLFWADEIFITNSWLGIQPVTQFADRWFIASSHTAQWQRDYVRSV